MEISDFIARIEEEFDDLEKGALTPESEFRKVMDWSSVNALIFIALINTEYDVVINAEDLKACKTVSEIYSIVKERMA